MNDKFLSLLGIAMKAGALSLGHDASKLSIRAGKAKACFTAADASVRLTEEMRGLFETGSMVVLPYTMSDIRFAIGKKAGVLTVNDENFAQKLMELTGGLSDGC